ncbi:MAG: hypothetical protein Tsb002_05940 [Wenzhouxiangellaceae bacterium]
MAPMDNKTHAPADWIAAFAQHRQVHDDGTHCPTDEMIYQAVSGELAPEQRGRIVSHTAQCGACALSWRVAAALTDAAAVTSVQPQQDDASSSLGRWLLGWLPPIPVWAPAAMAALVLGLGALWWVEDDGLAPPDASGVMRGAGQAQPQIVLPPDTIVSIRSPEVSWQSQADATVYSLRVFNKQAQLLLEVKGIQDSRYRFSAAELAALAATPDLSLLVTGETESGIELHSAIQSITLQTEGVH